MAKRKIIEQIVEGQGADAASTITTLLNQKLKTAIQEQRVVTAHSVYGEGETGNAGIDGRMNYIRYQIETQGDPGGVRRAALKRLETQIRK